MVKKDVIVRTEDGIDVETAGRLAITAERFHCKSIVVMGNHTINMHSLLNLVSVGIMKGDRVTVICEGIDEEAATERFEQIMSGAE